MWWACGRRGVGASGQVWGWGGGAGGQAGGCRRQREGPQDPRQCNAHISRHGACQGGGGKARVEQVSTSGGWGANRRDGSGRAGGRPQCPLVCPVRASPMAIPQALARRWDPAGCSIGPVSPLISAHVMMTGRLWRAGIEQGACLLGLVGGGLLHLCGRRGIAVLGARHGGCCPVGLLHADQCDRAAQWVEQQAAATGWTLGEARLKPARRAGPCARLR